MAAQSTLHSRRFCLELPTERDALKVAERIANKLAEDSKLPPGRVITVTDENGNVIGKVPVSRKS
jgi:hypothetical protein